MKTRREKGRDDVLETNKYEQTYVRARPYVCGSFFVKLLEDTVCVCNISLMPGARNLLLCVN